MSTPTPVTARRFALAVTLQLTVSLFAQSGPTTVRHDVHHDVSAPLREMILHAPPPSLEKHEAEPDGEFRCRPDSPNSKKTRCCNSDGVSIHPRGRSFEGLGQGQYGFSITGAPPDTNGTVGATQYVQWVNTSFAIFNKSTGALIAGPTAGNTLWSGFGGGCQTNNDGDPVVLYDKAAQRWIFSQFSVSTTPYLQCIAVSTTSDATGTYNRYSFQYGNFDDYPKMGVWSDGYYETFNMFNGNTLCRRRRLRLQPHRYAGRNRRHPSLLPARLLGRRSAAFRYRRPTAPPAGSPNYMVYFGTNNLNLFKFHVDFNTPSNSTFTGPTVIPVAAFSPLCAGGTCVPQPGTTQQLDSLADRLMYRLAYRNFGTHESLVVNHSVVAGSRRRRPLVRNPEPQRNSHRGAAEYLRSRLQLSLDGLGRHGSSRRYGARLQRVEQFAESHHSLHRTRSRPIRPAPWRRKSTWSPAPARRPPA